MCLHAAYCLVWAHVRQRGNISLFSMRVGRTGKWGSVGGKSLQYTYPKIRGTASGEMFLNIFGWPTINFSSHIADGYKETISP